MSVKKGNSVQIWHDPISRTKCDEIAVIAGPVNPLNWNDESGSPMFRATVVYADGHKCVREFCKADLVSS